jgi:protein-disulfide isomerase
VGRLSGVLLGTVLALSALTGAAAAQTVPPPPVTASDRTIGRADAPVTLILYASMTCPHCAQWIRYVLPEVKTRWIEPGHVRLVFRDLPTAPAEAALRAAYTSRCVAPDRAFPLIETLYAGQDLAYAAGWPDAWIDGAIDAIGADREVVKVCVSNPATEAGLRADMVGARNAGVRVAPTIFIDGVALADPSLFGLAEALHPLIEGR